MCMVWVDVDYRINIPLEPWQETGITETWLSALGHLGCSENLGDK